MYMVCMVHKGGLIWMSMGICGYAYAQPYW